MTDGPATLLGPGGEPVEIRRSARRRRTVSARREADRIVVLVPDTLSPAQEQEWVQRLVARVAAPTHSTPDGDADLLRRATELARRHLGGAAHPSSVRWVPPMRSRWASCTPADATIRVSERVRAMPSWVQDYVLLHELAHLIEPGHGPAFWQLLEDYPRTQRARGYLEGVTDAASIP